MGIHNLLPFLEKSTKSTHISEFRGKTVAVDSYCWLHKGARGCSEQLAKGISTDTYVGYCLKYVKLLLSHDIQPIMVFDGRYLPAKKITEDKRREERKRARKRAMELVGIGKYDEARRYFQQCVEINPEMALNLIKECRKLNVECIVAPYESDAQLAFFNLNGIVELVITEDSDLLLFGCKKVFYKMDFNGCGQLVESDKIHLSMKLKPEQYTFDKFRHMCILSGCDYVNSLPGIGLKKALKFITMTIETDPQIFLDKIPRYLNLKNVTVDDDYKKKFLIADATFKHQVVFDPKRRQLVRLNDLCDTNIEYCINAGELFDDFEAYQLALGNLNPFTMEKIDNWQPPSTPQKLPTSNYYSIWNGLLLQKEAKKEVKYQKIVESREEQEYNNTSISDCPDDSTEIENIIEIYKTKLETIEEESGAGNENIVEQQTSPIIGSRSRNPFLKPKISKFDLTNINKKIVVKSRFFSSNITNIDDKSINIDVNKQEIEDISKLVEEKTEKEKLPQIVATNTESPKRKINSNNTGKCGIKPAKRRRIANSSDGKQPTIRDMFKRMSTI